MHRVELLHMEYHFLVSNPPPDAQIRTKGLIKMIFFGVKIDNKYKKHLLPDNLILSLYPVKHAIRKGYVSTYMSWMHANAKGISCDYCLTDFAFKHPLCVRTCTYMCMIQHTFEITSLKFASVWVLVFYFAPKKKMTMNFLPCRNIYTTEMIC